MPTSWTLPVSVSVPSVCSRRRESALTFRGPRWRGLKSAATQPLPGCGTDGVRLCADDVHEAQDDFGEAGLIFFAEQGQQSMADAVTQHGGRGVGGVFAEAHFIFTRPGEQFGSGDAEQRADQGDFGVCRRRRTPFHSGEAFAARTAQQAQEEQFHLVVRVMRQGYEAATGITGGAREKFVAQFARGHFDGQFRLFSEVPHIGAFNHHGRSHGRGGPAYQAFVRIAAASAEPVIEMGDGQFPALARRERVQHMQQDHRVHAAGDGHQDTLAACEQAMFADAVI